MLATYEKALRELYTTEINKLLLELRQYKQRINKYLDKHANTVEMKQEADRAKIASTLASCRIDGIAVTDKRMDELMDGTVAPKTKKEREVAGYRFTLSTIDDSYPFVRISTGAILQLHRDLYRYIDVPFAGRWEDADKAVFRKQELGKLSTRLVSTVLISKQTILRDACTNYKQAIASKACDPLVATCMFALDFINIHPFEEGNGRMSRLMTLLMMYQNGYFAGSYAPLEVQIERTKPAYVKAIQAGARVIPEGGTEDDAETNYEPFVLYLLDAMLSCCKQFERDHELEAYSPEPARPAKTRKQEAEEAEADARAEAMRKMDADREERMRQRAAMKAQAQEALSNPPRMSKAGESLISAKEEKVSKAKHAAELHATRTQVKAPAKESPAKKAVEEKAQAPAALTNPGATNEDIVRAFFQNLEGTASKKDVVAACPGMSPKTVERIIQRLMAEGVVVKEGAARATVYRSV